jgi:hypothetical protein
MQEVAAAGGATDQVVSHQSCNEGNEATGRSSTGRARSAVGEDFGRHRWLRIRYVSGRRHGRGESNSANQRCGCEFTQPSNQYGNDNDNWQSD